MRLSTPGWAAPTGIALTQALCASNFQPHRARYRCGACAAAVALGGVLERAAAVIALYGASHRIVGAVVVRLLLLLPSGGSVRVRYWLRWRCGIGR